MMDVTDYFVMVVGLAVVAIVVYGGYHRAMQNRLQDGHSTSPASHSPSSVPAE